MEREGMKKAIGTRGAPGEIPFESLSNPVLSYPDWSVKDYACAYRDGVYHLFFSAFHEDRGTVRSQVVHVTTPDFAAFSEPLLRFDGTEEGWAGMCSPDIAFDGKQYILTFNSWGDLPGRPNQLFYKTSTDLIAWSEGYRPLAERLTAGNRAIDASVACADGTCYLFWKERTDRDRTRLAAAPAIDGVFEFVGEGYPALRMEDGRDNGLIHENFCFLYADGAWRLVSTDYRPHAIYLYTMRGDGGAPSDWLEWERGVRLEMEPQRWNTSHVANAAALYDWRERTGYYYMLYAGNTENETFAKRGHNRLGLARSEDLRHWEPCGHAKEGGGERWR